LSFYSFISRYFISTSILTLTGSIFIETKVDIKENNCERCFRDPMIVRLKSTNQAVDIITKVESSIPAHMEVHSIKPYVKANCK
jgi:hypothetical protein